MSDRADRSWISQEVERVRQLRQEQGHALSPLQEGIISAISASNPRHELSSRKELDDIAAAVRDHGCWSGQEEWRISTWFGSRIIRVERNGADWYEVSVGCDEQRLLCGCPSIEGAYAYMRLYQKLIVEQFYSVGPPWAAKSPFGA